MRYQTVNDSKSLIPELAKDDFIHIMFSLIHKMGKSLAEPFGVKDPALCGGIWYEGICRLSGI